MAAPTDNPVWPCLIKTIWARRLAGLAERDGGETGLLQAWSEAIATAWEQGWELDGVVPLAKGTCDHFWAIVVSRTAPEASMVLIHGQTPREALERTPPALAELS